MIPISKVTAAGVQAARRAGIVSERPMAKTISETKTMKKLNSTPLPINRVAPPRRAKRMLKLAAISTMAPSMTGKASREYQ